MIATALAAMLSLASFTALQAGGDVSPSLGSWSPGAGKSSSPTLDQIAADHPNRQVEVIAQFRNGTSPAEARHLVASFDGIVIRELPIIGGLGARLSASEAQRLGWAAPVKAVSLNAAVEHEGLVNEYLGNVATSYNQSIRSERGWDAGYTGTGVGVAVLDTGIQGDLPDFRVSETDPASRVIATATVNPGATNAGDGFGHGTHVAGLIAGDGRDRPSGDPQDGRYIGVAPDANLIAVKISDEQGNASVLDVIDGLQFITEHKADYNIRVANLSLKSSVAESYKTDPLDAAVEATWNKGIVVVTASGNSGTDADAVSYAPANDPYVVTVGAVDDMGTRAVSDDALTSWSSRGTTQDGFQKPEMLAPGAHMVSTIPAGSAYTQLCPTCVTDGSYFKVGGTSMAAAVVSGEAALILDAHPDFTPDQVKAQLIKRTRAVRAPSSNTLVDALGNPVGTDDTSSTIVGGEAAVDKAIENLVAAKKSPNYGLVPNALLGPDGQIDYNRASWSRASWSDAASGLRASWSRASWSRASWSRASWSATPESCSDFERASWSRASWSRASWSRASWSRASWSADGMTSPDVSSADLAAMDAEIAAAKAQCQSLLQGIDPSRASWSRASWSRASWSSSFEK